MRWRSSGSGFTAITAAVVGVIANLALWFAIHSVFREQVEIYALGMQLLLPEPASVNVPMLLISAAAFLLLFTVRVGVLPLLACSAMLGAGWVLVRGVLPPV